MSVFTTEEHARLDALLKKMVDLVPHLSEGQGEALFAIVAKFGRAGLEKQARQVENKFLQLDVEQLIGTATKRSKKQIVRAEDEEREEFEQLPKKRKEENSNNSSDKMNWSISEASNIVEVLSVTNDPFAIRLLAKPPVAGNRKPVEFVMDEASFDSISAMTGRPANKLKATLRARLAEFCSEQEHGFALTKLRATPWGGGNVE